MGYEKNIEKTISFIGFSKSGKTTVISELVKCLSGKGYKVGVIKHTTKNFEMDKEGKDSWRVYKAGADVVVLSPVKMAYQIHLGDLDLIQNDSITDKTRGEPSLEELTRFLSEYDILITEGFKREFYRGIAVAKNEDELKKLVDLLSESRGSKEGKANGRILAAVLTEGSSTESSLVSKIFQPYQIEELAEYILSLLSLPRKS